MEFVILTFLFTTSYSPHFFLWILVTRWCHFPTSIQLCSHPPLLCSFCQTYYISIHYKLNNTHSFMQLPFYQLREEICNYTFFYAYLRNYLHQHSVVLCVWIWITVWYHLLSAWGIYFFFIPLVLLRYNWPLLFLVRQFAINSFFLLLFIWECFILPSFKKYLFFQRFLSSLYICY